MDNYEYIISSLPVLQPDARPSDASLGNILAFIRSQLSARDNALVDQLLRGHDETQLGEAFYKEVLSSKDRFLREYFRFDLNLRNAKVRYLNQALNRPEDQDIFMVPDGVFEEAAKADAALNRTDILARERALDDLRWEKISAINLFDYFNIDTILGFIARYQIILRWLRLDEATGRRLFRTLVEEVRGTFKGVEYNE